jgi:SAM-dependent methyltransferase
MKGRENAVRDQKPSAPESKTGTRRGDTHVPPFDELASDYDAWFDEAGKPVFAIEVSAFHEVLPSLPKPWLEIGVGSGRFARALGIETGGDPSIRLLELARQRGISGFLGRGEQAPFGDESFGTVFLIVTLCFVDSPLDVLREASRILVPNGKIVLGLVLKESPWGKFYQRQKEQGHRFYRYATFYSYKEVAKLLKQSGFSIEQVISTLFQTPGKVNRMELPQRGYSSSAGFTVVVAKKSGASNR